MASLSLFQVSVVGEGVEDLVGGLGPAEGPGVLVPSVDPGPDVLLQGDRKSVV